MAATDAIPVPRKGVAYRVTFPILSNLLVRISGATDVDSEISKDGAAFADCTNEAIEIAQGVYYLDLTATEMNADTVVVIVKTTSLNAADTTIVLYPEEVGDYRIDPVAIRNAVGLGSANLDTQLGAIDDFLDTEVAAIKAKTDNLPSDPADASDIAASLAAISAFVDTEVAAIKAKTDLIPASPAAVGDAMTLSAAYDFAKGTAAMVEAYAANGVAPTPIQALFAVHQMLQSFAISGASLAVKKLDNSTTAFIVTLNDSSNPTGAARS